MERKIGEIFEYNGEWYQCLKSPDGGCKHCDTNFGGKCPIPIKECVASARSDLSYVIFKKLEKVGEPYAHNSVIVQKYRIRTTPVIMPNEPYMYFNAINNTIEIEIKQNKEDMEEYRMYDAKEDIPKFDKVIDECLFGEDKLNLKPFDLEAAKAGKPVCTRDGRKARIICFDRINGDYYKIVACVTAFDGDFEEVLFYGIDGYIVDSQNPKDEDLMILPEKKEGWVNVYREETNNNERLIEQTIYKTRKDAFDKACPKGYITTTKINWEE